MAGEPSGDLDGFIETLPDPAGARAFWTRLASVASITEGKTTDRLLMSRMLTLAGYSPYLAETLLGNPENIGWLQAETRRGFERVKSAEQLSEELARFATRAIGLDDSARLARFKRRELLRIYLRDCLAIATLSEVTEELSNLADAILGYALTRAHQEMINIHGAAVSRDERGRIAKAEVAVVALGKLGCRELNYASDIDLLFLYSGNGESADGGRDSQSAIGNKDFFRGVAERVVRMIGRSSDEGAAYRVDLRLRPYGRDGDMVWEVNRAAEYYRDRAHNWERQALIRARAAAGSESVVASFLALVRDVIFTPDALPGTLEDVRRAKEKIDRKEAARMRGFNVKLGPGGIREIEFIAQALQLKHGGREPWIRWAQTLIVLARLAEKRYLSERERAGLSAAYTFLRTVEHRLQMEHGAQTHTLPAAADKLALLARRCGYVRDDDASAVFTRDLETHTSAVRRIYERIFRTTDRPEEPSRNANDRARTERAGSGAQRLIKVAASRVAGLAGHHDGSARELEKLLAIAAPASISATRSLRNLAAWSESLATYTSENLRAIGWTVDAGDWPRLIERLVLVISSQYFAHLLVSRPLLASALVEESGPLASELFSEVLRDAVSRENDLASRSDALRRAWHRLIVRIGYEDMCVVANLNASGNQPGTGDAREPATEHLRVINRAQTALAEATLRIAVEITLETLDLGTSLPGKPSETDAGGRAALDELPPFSILGLGRLGHAGMDYGSDLDLLVVFDDDRRWSPGAVAASGQEFYAKFTARLVRVLSSITREGLLYRIDLRLRPEGKSGPVALGLGSLVSYISNRASGWEHSAYLKAREVAGDLEFGARARRAICDASFEAASGNPSLKEELRDMRGRLVKEKARSGRPNIKWGRGGMTDVYFVTRYLQLRDRSYFPPDRGTSALIAYLGGQGALDRQDSRALFDGYMFLRRLDHWMRLLLDRPGPTLPASAASIRELTRALGLGSASEFEEVVVSHTESIRDIFDRVFS